MRAARRRREPPFEDVAPATDALAEVLAPYLAQGCPWLLVGHSLGTWVGYNLWLKLAAKGVPPPLAPCSIPIVMPPRFRLSFS